MTLDAYTAGVARLMAAAYPDLGGTVTDAVDARHRYSQARFPTGPAMAAVEDTSAAGVPVRVYRPLDTPPRPPVIVYYHGGGFVLCGLDTHDGVCRILADRVGAVVVSVDYRLAPEHRFPAAPDDAYTAVCWTAGAADDLGVDPDRLAVAGDSAGGALAAVTCLRARDRGHPRIACQALVYPVTDCLAHRVEVPDSLLTAAHMRWYTDQYLRSRKDGEHPYASPLRARDLSGLPPAVVLTAGHDPLRAEGRAFAERLAVAGTPVDLHHVDGLFHGVFGLGSLVPVARHAEDLVCGALRAALDVPAHRPPATARDTSGNRRSARTPATTNDGGARRETHHL